MSLPEASLQQAANDRKARLQALRKRKAGETSEDPDGGQGSSFSFKPRNFDPVTRQPLKRSKTGAGEPDEDNENGNGSAGGALTVEDRVKGVAARVIAEDERKRKEDLDLLNIAPKRANWDLKRDMDRRTRKLERKTVESYNILFRQRQASLKQISPANPSSTSVPSSGKGLLANMQAAEEQNRKQVAMDDEDEDEDEQMGEME